MKEHYLLNLQLTIFNEKYETTDFGDRRDWLYRLSHGC